MKQSELIQLISAPQNAALSDVDKLDVLTKEFPFFQSAHVLLTLTSKKHNSSLYQQTLRNTAISIPNRSRLHYLLNFNEINKTAVVEIEKKVEVKEIVKPVSEIEHLKKVELQVEKVFTEEQLNEQVEKEIEKQIVSVIVEKQIFEIPEKEKKTEAKKTISEGTFTDWLKTLKEDKPEVEEYKQSKVKVKTPDQQRIDKKEEQNAIIAKILEANPGKIVLKDDAKFFSPDTKAKESLFENEDIVTETLAKIYAVQGNVQKAVRAYEILSLKFPQKSVYFASLIENLKKK